MSRFVRTIPYRTLATDNFSSGAFECAKSLALKMREIAPDPPGWLTAIRLDIDRSDGATAWLDAELPQPSLVVTNRLNGHAHLMWMLARWVAKDKPKSVRYADQIRGALSEALGADAAYCGKFTHNPACGFYSVRQGPPAYALSELSVHLDVYVASDKSTRYQELYANGGRNCALFEEGRRYAYGIVRGYRRLDDRVGFADAVTKHLLSTNAELSNCLSEREVSGIARSIIGWTWARYARVTALRGPRYKTSRAQYLGDVSARRSSAVRLADAGASLDNIATALGVSERTARRYVDSLRVNAA